MWSAAGCSRPVQTAAPCWQYCRWCQMKTASPLQIFVECWFWWDNNSFYRSNNLLRDETIVRLLFVCFLFALFFLPHTWNVALTHGGQYSNQLILRCTKVRWRFSLDVWYRLKGQWHFLTAVSCVRTLWRSPTRNSSVFVGGQTEEVGWVIQQYFFFTSTLTVICVWTWSARGGFPESATARGWNGRGCSHQFHSFMIWQSRVWL